MVGNTVIIVILLAIGFQVIRLHIKMDKQLKEVSDRLNRIEELLNQKSS